MCECFRWIKLISDIVDRILLNIVSWLPQWTVYRSNYVKTPCTMQSSSLKQYTYGAYLMLLSFYFVLVKRTSCSLVILTLRYTLLTKNKKINKNQHNIYIYNPHFIDDFKYLQQWLIFQMSEIHFQEIGKVNLISFPTISKYSNFNFANLFLHPSKTYPQEECGAL